MIILDGACTQVVLDPSGLYLDDKEGGHRPSEYQAGSARVCTSVRECAPVCTGVNECAQVCTRVHACAQVCTIVHKCAQVCISVHKCA